MVPDPNQAVQVSTLGGAIVLLITVPDLLRSATVERVDADLVEAAEANPGAAFVIDFSAVTAVSSELVGSLIVLQKMIAGAHGQLRLCAIAEPIMRTLRLSRVDTAFRIFPDRDSAIGGDTPAES
jgi:anti-sigma B factor antagonist